MIEISIRKESDVSERYSANWTDATARYHVWITPGRDGVLRAEETIYKNPLVRPDGTYPNRGDADHFETRKLYLRADANRKIAAAIDHLVHAGETVRKAAAEREATVEAARLANVAKLVRDRRERLTLIAEATHLTDLRLWIEAASDDDIVAMPGECFGR